MDLVKMVLDLLYPPRCPFCGRVLEAWEEEGLCRRCQASLPWMEGSAKSVEFCQACLSPLWYGNAVKRGMASFKFRGGRVHARVFALLMAQCLQDRWGEPVDWITWVPVSSERLRRRGYDQCQLLALRVGEMTGLQVVPTLEKVRDTKQQSLIVSSSARRANVVGAYAVKDGVDATGKRVVLVDDVVTSGATLSECAACLRMAGAEEVVGLTLARAR